MAASCLLGIARSWKGVFGNQLSAAETLPCREIQWRANACAIACAIALARKPLTGYRKHSSQNNLSPEGIVLQWKNAAILYTFRLNFCALRQSTVSSECEP